MQRFRTITACALAVAMACLAADPLFAQPEPDAQKEPKEQAEEQQEADEAQGRKAAARRRRTRASESMVWWNSPSVVEQLSLADEQRAKMDGYLRAYRRKEPEDNRRPSFGDALAAGSWLEARAQLKQLEDQAVASIRARGELKIDVLSILSEDQRKTLVERYDRLIRQRWANAMQLPEPTGPGPGRAEPPSE